MPIFWSEEQLGWLTGSYMLRQIADRKFNIRNDDDAICEECVWVSVSHCLRDSVRACVSVCVGVCVCG